MIYNGKPFRFDLLCFSMRSDEELQSLKEKLNTNWFQSIHAFPAWSANFSFILMIYTYKLLQTFQWAIFAFYKMLALMNNHDTSCSDHEPILNFRGYNGLWMIRIRPRTLMIDHNISWKIMNIHEETNYFNYLTWSIIHLHRFLLNSVELSNSSSHSPLQIIGSIHHHLRRVIASQYGNI